MSKYAHLRDDDWPPIVPRDPPGLLVRRFLVSTAVGTAMAVTVYLCAWNGMRYAPGYRPEIRKEYDWMRNIKSALDDHRKQSGNYPENLAALKAANPDEIREDEGGRVIDTWGNSYLYHVEGDSYTLISFGRDGKLGGQGMDEDIDARVVRSSREEYYDFPAVGVPTLRQFAFECETVGVRLASALAGIFAFIACIVAWKPNQHGLIVRAAGLVMTLAVCLLTGIVMCSLHIPSGH